MYLQDKIVQPVFIQLFACLLCKIWQPLKPYTTMKRTNKDIT